MAGGGTRRKIARQRRVFTVHTEYIFINIYVNSNNNNAERNSLTFASCVPVWIDYFNGSVRGREAPSTAQRFPSPKHKKRRNNDEEDEKRRVKKATVTI